MSEQVQELWVLTYLHNWNGDGRIFPEVSAIFRTFQEAEAARLAKIDPLKYWVRRGNLL